MSEYSLGNLVRRGSDVTDSADSLEGRGIYNSGVLTATDAHLDDNTAAPGAGLFNGSTYSGIENALIGNTASSHGGSAYPSRVDLPTAARP